MGTWDTAADSAWRPDARNQGYDIKPKYGGDITRNENGWGRGAFFDRGHVNECVKLHNARIAAGITQTDILAGRFTIVPTLVAVDMTGEPDTAGYTEDDVLSMQQAEEERRRRND